MHTTIRELVARTRREDREWWRERAEEEAEFVADEERVRCEVLPNLRRAKPRHYREWLRGFLASGGKPTHFYDYPLPSTFYVARRDFTLVGLCGSGSYDVIVPAGIKVTIERRGHCNLFFMDGFTSQGHFVPVYSDTVV